MASPQSSFVTATSDEAVDDHRLGASLSAAGADRSRPSSVSSSQHHTPSLGSTHAPSTSSASWPPPHTPIPTEPMPDSILCRSTFAALEHSAGTMKRLAKHVASQASSVLALLEQLESAEDELLGALGELGRWLEGGYGVTGDVWDAEGGIRKVASERRRRDREDLEVMVVHSLEAVKGEIKRQGLAGHGAQAKFESVAKQYYQSTASYLSSSTHDAASDNAHATRTAQWELVRYNHHSTLLYAVPPSSVGCLDLLVGLYGWVGSQISHVPGRRADTHALEVDEFTGAVTASPARPGNETPTQRGRQLAQMETPVRILTRDDKSARSSVDAVARTLAQSLGHLHEVRGDLLAGWAERDKQTTLLEDNTRQLAEGVPEASRLHLPAVEPAAKLGAKDKPRKMHRVGGKIRGLFSSSSTNTTAANSGTGGNLPTLAERAPPVSSANANRRSVDLTRPIPKSRALATPPVASSGSRPSSRQRHSVQVAQGAYRSPFNPAETSPDPSSERSTALAEATAKLNGVSISITGVGGVGGLNGEGDEDEQREQVGRKKEGVLWGTGTWEDLDKGGFKGKWEHFWVVLAHSKIYEYRDSSRGESNATVIDLKFASVREGRGTDRRFVFEVVTPSHGRRLYQAVSEAEMRTWIYALCNAIESCINGTSTLRSSDFRVLQQSADFAEPRRKKSPIPFSSAPARHSFPANPSHTRRTSLKDRFMSDLLPSGKSSTSPSPDGRPDFLTKGGRMPSNASSSHSHSQSQSQSQSETDAENAPHQPRRRSPLPLPPLPADPNSPNPAIPTYDMQMLRVVADSPANSVCADCGRRTKSSRWATVSLREMPMVMFLCIRCCGVHRGLGTHVSKPRSVDLDRWTEQSVSLACNWGNTRGNALWERCKPANVVATDETIGDYIRSKYVKALWVTPEDRVRYGLGGSDTGHAAEGVVGIAT